MDQESIIRQIIEKYQKQGENPETYLKGFLEAKPVNYWDYINVEALLALQNTRTDYVDEENFIIYSQITELFLKSILHELRQITGQNNPSEETLLLKVSRVNKYTELIIHFFEMMTEGVDYDQYNKFRMTLAPASGFQSVQFRYVELYSTRIDNLLDDKAANETSIEDRFERIYWKSAGINKTTGAKTITLRQFEEKYQDKLIALANQVKGNTLEDKILALARLSPPLKEKLRNFDHFFNVQWPMAHVKTAAHFLKTKGETKKGTGGTEWSKYLHPQFQQRKFFPSLWSQYELDNWGSYKV